LKKVSVFGAIVFGQQHCNTWPNIDEYLGLVKAPQLAAGELLRFLDPQPPLLEVPPPEALGIDETVKISQLQAALTLPTDMKNIPKKLIIKNVFFITI
jgi:hypothetical protein